MRSDELKVEALCREILDSVLREIKGEYEGLPPSLRELTDDTRENYEQEAATMRNEHRQHDGRERIRSISQAQFKAQKDVLQKRDTLLDELLNKGYEEALEQWNNTKDVGLVVHLVEEGVVALDCDDIVISIDKTKEEAFGKDLQASLKSLLRKDVKVKFELDLAGVTIERADGRAVYDNTIKDRFRRCTLQLRAELATLLDEEVKRQREQNH